MKSYVSFPGLKLSLIAAAVFAFAACNNESADKKPEADTSTTVSENTPPVPDHTATNHEDTASVPLVEHAEAVISGTVADTTVDGTAKFDAKDGKVKLTLSITVPKKANQSVAVHLHEHGDCGDRGNMSHGHWNPTKAEHGKWGSASFHLGDIGNVKLDAKGKGSLTLETDLWTLGGKPASNILGRAVIVHNGVDDFKTQPTGNAGSRIGCGVIK